MGSEIAGTRLAVERAIGEQKGDIMRWMFGLWATQMLATIGLIASIWLRGQ